MGGTQEKEHTRIPITPLHTLLWQEDQSRYELYTRQQLEQAFEPEDFGAWLIWLENATAFAFRGACGSLNVYQEARKRGGRYWYAYHTNGKHTRKRYLGRTTQMTFARMEEAAHSLHQNSSSPSPGSQSLQEPALASDRVMSVTPSEAEQGMVLLSTKLTPPLVPSLLVGRDRLLTRLDAARAHRLTLLSASAGWGKTILLSTWASRCAFPLAWLSLDKLDNDPIRFWIAVLSALRTCLPGVGQTALLMLRSPQPPPLSTILTTLLNELSGQATPTFLLLDDYHLIDEQAIHDSMLFLLDHLPAHLHLVLSSRVDPPLALARLRARGQLLELRDVDLRFEEEETARFLTHTMNLSLSQAEIAELARYTEGWIAGLQLLALALRGKSDAVAFLRTHGGNHHFLLEYLSEEVLAQQPPETRRFLLRTCILERMTGSLCDAVTGEAGGQAKLSALLRANLFVSALDDTQTWYRYHPLFAQALRSQLEKLEPTLVPALYHRASCWHEQHQEAEVACEYAFLAGDLPRAATLLSDLVPQLFEQGHILRSRQWLSRLPPALVAVSAPLGFVSIWLLGADKTAQGNAEKLVAYFDQHLQVPPQDYPASRVDLSQWLRLFQAGAALTQGDFPRTISLARESLHVLSGPETAWNHLLAVRLRVVLAAAYRACGDLNATEQLLLQACPPGETRTDLICLLAATSLAELYEAQGQLRKLEQLSLEMARGLEGCSDLLLLFLALTQVRAATLLYERNQLGEAEARAQQAMELAGRLDLSRAFFLLELGQHLALPLPLFPVLSRWVQARVARAGGNDEQARHLLTPEEFPMMKVPLHEREKSVTEAISARLALAHGQFELAQRWEATCGLGPLDPLSPGLSSSSYLEYVTLARVLIARGRRERNRAALSQALRLLDHLRDLVMRMGLHGWFLEIHMLTALALQAQGKIKQALTTLGAVLAQAEPEGYVRLFADEGEPMAPLLARISGSTTASASYIQRLQDALAHTASVPAALTDPAAALQPQPSLLSPREQEVLALLAMGLSNQQIAEHLVLSLNTVKCHVKHLLAKLVVTNRTQALVRARELHLL